MRDYDWRAQTQHIILSPGDIVVDIVNSQVGVLVKKERRDVHGSDFLDFWFVTWSSGIDVDATSAPNRVWLEEQSLKLSIVVGFYDLYAQSSEKD